ncbi:MAG TPA: acyltransferase [Ardenticatenaceae bacterium]|nr:acyltransferase [Ardenticatenaceae bacterium]
MSHRLVVPKVDVASHRRERLRVSPSLGPENALSYWWKTVSPLRVAWNFSWIYAARYSPSLALKRWMLRRAGIAVGRAVSVGLGVVFDVFYPQEITIGDNSIIGYNSVVLAHEYMVAEWRRGPVVIGRNVSIGANVTILPGVVIGDGATVSAMSLVNKDVPPGTFVGGVPIRPLGGRDG